MKECSVDVYDKNKVSVVVPIYNVEYYLRRCIESIINQSYKNLEIILVDDGSPDACPEICDDYVKKDDRIKVIHQENSGVSVARNNGIKLATGEYLVFADSDDYLEINMIEECIKISEKKNLDILLFDWYDDFGDGKIKKFLDRNYLKNRDMILYGILWDKIPSYPWNKFFRRKIWDNVKFLENTTFEDLAIMPEIFNKANRIGYLNKHLYNYNCTNSTSITSNISCRNKFGMYISWKSRLEFAQELKLSRLANYCKIRSIRSAITGYSLNCYEKKLNKDQVDSILSFLVDEFEANKNDIGIKYKFLGYCVFKWHSICYLYGLSMFKLQEFKRLLK